ncbi:TRAP transporter small permease subunit [Alteromonas sediminis]|nr:TRAP transporter small permease subunit [Alteromonas sediminis]
MALTTFVVVVLRYGFNLGWVALQESIQYQHAFVFMLFAAHALGQDEHVRVDIFYRHWSGKQQAWVNIFGTIAFLFPVCMSIVFYSWSYVLESWRLLEGSKEAGGLPLVFVMKSLIPAFAVLMMLQGIAIVLRAMQSLLNTTERAT